VGCTGRIRLQSSDRVLSESGRHAVLDPATEKLEPSPREESSSRDAREDGTAARVGSVRVRHLLFPTPFLLSQIDRRGRAIWLRPTSTADHFDNQRPPMPTFLEARPWLV
jgi:hypothetical protein